MLGVLISVFNYNYTVYKASATTQCSFLLSSEKHFVDQHRRFLIKNVTAVDSILDLLLEEDIITDEDYENVRSKSTRQDQMRELYSFLKSSKAKDIFYKGLEEEEKLLLDDL